jgi:ASC-1-like (ASCH) protein
MIHDLKINDEYLENLDNGTKKNEIRLNDRDYQKGDLLRFSRGASYPRPVIIKEYLFEITHIHSGLGLRENYVVLSVIKV